ncbi:MAG TPA: hypothetical protein VGO60_18920 [Iamia sp.]|nr:hypothetical protein [Iamia sp.]
MVDLPLAGRAALNGLVFVGPAAVAGVLLADGDGDLAGGPAVVIAIVQIVGFCFAGWVVRRMAITEPIATCALAGLGCAVIIQVVGIVTTVIRGQDLNPLTWIATALVAALAGCAGGLLARTERVQPSRHQERP